MQFLHKDLTAAFLALCLFVLPSVGFTEEGEDVSALEALPVEILEEIMAYLPPEDLSRLMGTNKIFFRLGENNSTWRSICILNGIEQLDRLNQREQIEEIQNISLNQLSGLSWRDLYLVTEKLSYSSDKFLRIKAPFLRRGLVGTLGATLCESMAISAVGVPLVMMVGIANQIQGAGLLMLSAPAILLGPETSLLIGCLGISSIFLGTAAEVSACFIPGTSLFLGYLVQKELRETEIKNLKAKFESQQWLEIRDKFRDCPIPLILKVFRRDSGA